MITEAAKGLFNEHGYANVSIEDIADVLGVRKGALYYHVARKASLLTQIVSDLLQPIARRVDEIAGSSRPPLDKLRVAASEHVEHILANQAAARIFFEQARDLPPDERVDLDQLGAVITRAFGRIIAEGIDSGAFRAADPDLLTLQVLALCNWPYRWFRRSGPSSMGRVRAATVESVLLLVTSSTDASEEET
ncbi:MAG TPA: TetR family transcriptional regulator [Candidatus Dormibacteraeota bacterium]|nr:TetR family transcriptional regulator [Candidatus Dormibacteraeota bacterium]